MRRWMFGLGALIGTTALVMACGVGNDCDFGLCAGSPVGGDGGDGGEADGPMINPDCDLTKSPKDSPACVDDGAGVFVSPAGTADAAGTKNDPLSSITAAISKAVSSKRPRVYICDGKYTEAIKLTSAVSIYGGFDCTWTHTGVRPKIAPPKGPAIEISRIADEVSVQDVDATGLADAAVKGASAVGALLIGSKRVVLKSVAISAGRGQDGAEGTTTANYAGTAPASAGSDASGAGGGPEKTCSCVDGSKSVGGHGADGNGTNTSDGSSVPPTTPVNFNGGGSAPNTCAVGGVGAPGEPGGVGEPIAAPGIITATGWDASKLGGAGKSGAPGQGGGGGGAKTMLGGAGGGGGCGGCGGGGGTAGGNGGASIAILSIDSTLSVDASALTSDSGGNGGPGGQGQAGQDGGGGGASLACAGGSGGIGAGGSGGPGGAGGDSFALAWAGPDRPSVTATELKPGEKGGGGDGGQPGLGAGKPGVAGKPGIPGRSVASFPQ